MKTETLTALIFSRNNLKFLSKCVKSVYNQVDKIVIIDSSDHKIHKNLFFTLYKKKIKIYNIKALGYVEPYRQLGVSLCNTDWILYLDSDETLSCNVNVKKYLNNKVAAYAINRITLDKANVPVSDNSYDIRLYRKHQVRYHGIIHESPEINGLIKKLPKNIKIYNLAYDYNNNISKLISCLIIESFENRIQYKNLLNKKYLKTLDNEKQFTYNIFRLILKLNPKKKDGELSKFDYNTLLLIRLVTIAIFNLISYKHLYHKQIIRWFQYERYKIAFFTSLPKNMCSIQLKIQDRIQNSHSVMAYLGLNSLRDFKSLNRIKLSGINLLVYLFISRYVKDRKKRLLLYKSFISSIHSFDL